MLITSHGIGESETIKSTTRPHSDLRQDIDAHVCAYMYVRVCIYKSVEFNSPLLE